MENWRTTVVDILRESNGKAHLNDLYEKINSLSDLPNDWKAGVRRTLEVNSSDSEAWNGKHDLFQNEEKGSGNWSLKVNGYKEAIFNNKTKFFF